MRIVLVTLLCVVPTMAFGQAFGTRDGMKIEEFASSKALLFAPGTWQVEPPQPNANFEDYRAIIGQRTGLCSVIASTKKDEVGDAHAIFGATETALAARYGSPDEREGTMYDNARSLRYFGHPGDTGTITLSLHARAVFLSYEFRPGTACVSEWREPSENAPSLDLNGL